MLLIQPEVSDQPQLSGAPERVCNPEVPALDPTPGPPREKESALARFRHPVSFLVLGALLGAGWMSFWLRYFARAQFGSHLP